MAYTQYLDIYDGTKVVKLTKISSKQYSYRINHTFDSYSNLVSLLPLLSRQHGHVSNCYRIDKNCVDMFYQLNYDHLAHNSILDKAEYLRLLYLSNFGYLLDNEKYGYTYILHPDNIVYDSNLIPSTIYVGLQEELYPNKQSKSELLFQFKCLVVYTLKATVKYEYLINGAIHYIKKDSFEKSVYDTTTYQELLVLIKNRYYRERSIHMSNYCIFSKSDCKTYYKHVYVVTLLCFLLIIVIISLIIYKHWSN